MRSVSIGQEDPSQIYNRTGNQVWKQLLPDFPATAIEWVKHTPWEGPIQVPLSEIDFDNRKNWTASREPKKVKLHMQLIKENQSKPVILARIPGNPKLVCLDAHHRLLGYEALHQNPIAYIADVAPEDVEAALTMHSHQYSGGSKLSDLNGT